MVGEAVWAERSAEAKSRRKTAAARCDMPTV
jgi:hypothetical protein